VSIEKGGDWGAPAPVPGDAVWVADDRAAAEVVSEARRRQRPPPPLVLTGGDLARTLGGRGDRPSLRAGEGTHVTVDVGAALLDGELHWFVAHLVARRSWLRGRIVVAANAAFHGDWNLAPRAHPGDGRLDVLDGDLSSGDRLKARRRLPSGSHLPHPDIRVRRAAALQLDLGRATPVYLDRRRVAEARHLSLRIEPDALAVWV
jgi:hypothetical protein